MIGRPLAEPESLLINTNVRRLLPILCAAIGAVAVAQDRPAKPEVSKKPEPAATEASVADLQAQVRELQQSLRDAQAVLVAQRHRQMNAAVDSLKQKVPAQPVSNENVATSRPSAAVVFPDAAQTTTAQPAKRTSLFSRINIGRRAAAAPTFSDVGGDPKRGDKDARGSFMNPTPATAPQLPTVLDPAIPPLRGAVIQGLDRNPTGLPNIFSRPQSDRFSNLKQRR